MALGWRDQYTRYREFFLNIQTLYKKRADLRAFIELILSILTVIVFLNFALKPTALTIISLYNDIQGKRKTLEALNQKITNLNIASNLLNQNQNLIPDIDNSVGDSPKPDLISEQIQALGAKDSVTVLGISIGQIVLVGTGQAPKTVSGLAQLPDNANSMDISVSVRGDYPNLISFLKDYENLRTVTKIDTTGISSSTTDKGQIIVNVISGRVPYLGK